MDSAKSRGRGSSNSKGDDNKPETGSYNHDLRNHHDHYISSVTLKITLLFTAVGITFLLLDGSAHPTQFLRRSYSLSSCDDHAFVKQNVLAPLHQFVTRYLPFPEKEKRLEVILRKAAMKDRKTVILTTLNAAWTDPNSIFDLFLEGFRIGNGTQYLLKHIVVGALDQKAYSRCVEAKLHCYALTTDGVDFSGYANYMSKDYLKMMWKKIDLQRAVLEMGYDLIYTDGDIVWFRDPFPRFYPDADVQIASDHYWSGYTDTRNTPNAGFIYTRSNNRTILFYKFWDVARHYFPKKHDQDVLKDIKRNPFIKEIGLDFRYLETAYFSGFCEHSKDMDLVITMHANCCVGQDSKVHDIKMVMDDWKRYMNLSSTSWSVGGSCFNRRA